MQAAVQRRHTSIDVLRPNAMCVRVEHRRSVRDDDDRRPAHAAVAVGQRRGNLPGAVAAAVEPVPAVPQQDDPNSLWIVRSANGKKRCKQGDTLVHGDVIRLQHAATKLNLHSHLHQSPLSKQQEVSAYGPDGNGDASDNWRVVIPGAKDSAEWLRGIDVEFQHVETGQFLHSHNVQFKNPIPGQQEVSAVPNRNSNTKWTTEEGIYFPEVGKSRPLVTEPVADVEWVDTSIE